MQKDINDVFKQLDKSAKNSTEDHKEIIKNIDSLQKEQDKIVKELNNIKKEFLKINDKLDVALEILNSFTIILDEGEEDEDFDSDESWVPKEWSPDDDEDEDDESYI
jgi:uncharacterized protein Yka (UPF0111/DUF47 family)